MSAMPRLEPFDTIAFGDGRGSPHVDEDMQAVLLDQWRALNAAEVPTIG